jgi:chemotaxis protein CheX
VTATARVDLAPEDVAQVVDDIAGAFLGTGASQAPPLPESPRGVVACVHVTGAFRGSVVLSVTEPFGVFCAAAMLDVDPEAVDGDALVDTVGELANMIGGSVKALLPEPSVLSLPVVSRGDGRGLTVPGATTLTTTDLTCAGETLRVTVLVA